MDALRAPFPYLGERAYLDTAAAGLTWHGHGSAAARFYDDVKCRGFDARPAWLATTQKVRVRLASWLSVSPADITFVSCTTEGLNLAAHSLRWRAGDRVVLAADEFPSLARAWEPARRAGAELINVAIPREHERESALLAALDAATRVLAVSQTHWSTGTTLDLARLGAQCRARDVLLVVDGIQALGAVPTDLSAVDVYAASFFKWMLSGFGLGVLVTSPRARAQMEPAFRGYANIDDPTQLQYAHVNLPALYGFDATLDFFERIGWPTVFERVRQLGEHLIHGAARRGLELVTPAAMRAGIFALRCGDGEAVRLQLAARGISVAARGPGVRVSPHFYNTPDELDRCLDAFAEVATHP
jgi:cysteine desulfurase/selenocysteine lyase